LSLHDSVISADRESVENASQPVPLPTQRPVPVYLILG
jgi:hypothetical protein